MLMSVKSYWRNIRQHEKEYEEVRLDALTKALLSPPDEKLTLDLLERTQIPHPSQVKHVWIDYDFDDED